MTRSRVRLSVTRMKKGVCPSFVAFSERLFHGTAFAECEPERLQSTGFWSLVVKRQYAIRDLKAHAEESIRFFQES